jgi:hypothetical protein
MDRGKKPRLCIIELGIMSLHEVSMYAANKLLHRILLTDFLIACRAMNT